MAFISARRFMDFVYAALCAIQIVIACVFDFQTILGEYYPYSLRKIFENYTKKYKDCVMAEPGGWLKGCMWIELLIMMPYLPIAIYAFLKGVRKCPWIRIPSIINATSVLTMCLGMDGMYYASRFTGYKHPCPSTMKERLRLMAVLAPALLIFVIMIIDLSVFAVSGHGKATTGKPKSSKGAVKKGT